MNRVVFSLLVLAILVVIVSGGYALPISSWKFDEGSGTIATDSVDGNHGTIYGATWTTGIVGGALSFDGVDDYVDCGDDPSLDITDEITIEMWVMPDSLPSAYYNLISKGDPPQHSHQAPWQLAIGNNGKLSVYRLKDDNFSAEYNICDIPIGSWTYIAVTFDKNSEEVKTYKNGQFVRGWSKTNSIFTDNVDVTIAAQTYEGVVSYFFHGLIDEVAIYDRALTAEEIEQHYQGVIPEPTTIVLMGFGVLGLLGIVIRQRRKVK